MIDTRRGTFAGPVLAVALTLAGCGGSGAPAAAPSVAQNPAGAEAMRSAADAAASMANNAIDASSAKVWRGGNYVGKITEKSADEGDFTTVFSLYLDRPDPKTSHVSGTIQVSGTYDFQSNVSGTLDSSSGNVGLFIADFYGGPAKATATVSDVAISGAGYAPQTAIGSVNFTFKASPPPSKPTPTPAPCAEPASSAAVPDLRRC